MKRKVKGIKNKVNFSHSCKSTFKQQVIAGILSTGEVFYRIYTGKHDQLFWALWMKDLTARLKID